MIIREELRGGRQSASKSARPYQPGVVQMGKSQEVHLRESLSRELLLAQRPTSTPVRVRSRPPGMSGGAGTLLLDVAVGGEEGEQSFVHAQSRHVLDQHMPPPQKKANAHKTRT